MNTNYSTSYRWNKALKGLEQSYDFVARCHDVLTDNTALSVLTDAVRTFLTAQKCEEMERRERRERRARRERF